MTLKDIQKEIQKHFGDKVQVEQVTTEVYKLTYNQFTLTMACPDNTILNRNIGMLKEVVTV